MAIETRTEYATCWKCHGSGYYLHFGQCFTCGGTGKSGRKRRVAVNPADQPALDAQKARARERAREKRDEAAAKVWDQNVADYPFLTEADERSDLWHVAEDILIKARRYPISAKQAAVVERALERAAQDDERKAEREAEAALRSPAPEGRLTFTGTVEWTGLKQTQYGVTRKIRVLTDDGWACYGTAPASIIQVEGGDRVTMTATLKPTDDDPTFAWFSRPAKATLTKCEALAA